MMVMRHLHLPQERPLGLNPLGVPGFQPDPDRASFISAVPVCIAFACLGSKLLDVEIKFQTD